MRAHRAWRPSRALILCGLIWLGLSSCPTRAAEVDILLVLAVDASGSVDQERFELQQRGYVRAFRDPRLLRAIRGGPNGAIAVTMTQWTGPTMQAWVLPWMVVSDEASATGFAGAVATAPRQLFGGGTSLSGAIAHAATLFAKAPVRATRHVIDVSGDGANNRGAPAQVARDAAVAQGITINGLPILALEPGLDAYYRDHVIGGPRAFLIVAQGYENFADAILRKLILEISDLGGPVRDAVTVDPGQRRSGADQRSSRQFGPDPSLQEQYPCPIHTKPCMPNHSNGPGSSSPMAARRAY